MTDTEKFKLELEADNPGVTEALESRAEIDMRNLRDNISVKQTAQEVRIPSSRRIADMGQIIQMQKQQKSSSSQPVHSKNSFSTPDHHHHHHASSSSTPQSQQQQPQQRRPVGNVLAQGHGNNMLARAASQAIAATQNLPMGRRTASLKASYEASVRDTPSTLSRDQSVDRNDGLAGAVVTSAYAQNERRKRQSHKKMDACEFFFISSWYFFPLNWKLFIIYVSIDWLIDWF